MSTAKELLQQRAQERRAARAKEKIKELKIRHPQLFTAPPPQALRECFLSTCTAEKYAKNYCVPEAVACYQTQGITPSGHALARLALPLSSPDFYDEEAARTINGFRNALYRAETEEEVSWSQFTYTDGQRVPIGRALHTSSATGKPYYKIKISPWFATYDLGATTPITPYEEPETTPAEREALAELREHEWRRKARRLRGAPAPVHMFRPLGERRELFIKTKEQEEIELERKLAKPMGAVSGAALEKERRTHIIPPDKLRKLYALVQAAGYKVEKKSFTLS